MRGDLHGDGMKPQQQSGNLLQERIVKVACDTLALGHLRRQSRMNRPRQLLRAQQIQQGERCKRGEPGERQEPSRLIERRANGEFHLGRRVRPTPLLSEAATRRWYDPGPKFRYVTSFAAPTSRHESSTSCRRYRKWIASGFVRLTASYLT